MDVEHYSEPNLRYYSTDDSFNYHHIREDQPNPRDHKLHYEQGCEIYMFIRGNGSYTIEGNKYELEPYSLLMMNPNELHLLNISDQYPYERIVLTINGSFLPPFMASGIDFLRAIKHRKLGHNNQIKAESIIHSGMLELYENLEKRLIERNPENEFVAKCIIVQILSTINQLTLTDLPRAAYGRVNRKVRAVLEYINSNLDQQLSLDALCEQFYITKYYLCRTFKDATGYSINQYIT